MVDLYLDQIFEDIVYTMHQPFLVLNSELRVTLANHSYYEIFKIKPEETIGKLIYNLNNNEWDIPELREILETIIPKQLTVDKYKVEYDFTNIGRRIMLLNARQIHRKDIDAPMILLARLSAIVRSVM